MRRRLWSRGSLAATVLATRAGAVGPRVLAGVRWVAGVIFVSFGAAKFTSHRAELASFRHYPLLAPGFFVYLVGVVEATRRALARGRPAHQARGARAAPCSGHLHCSV